MGVPLVRLLHESGYAVSVTSRRERAGNGVSYIRGSAQDTGFVSELMRGGWDAVIDFMSRSLDNQKQTLAAVLPKTGQYVFISSARVYAPSDTPLTEDSPRLLDVCTDRAYLATEEYALTKAREENLLYESGQTNWTIVRPTLTYNTYRLQFALGEKEDWLYRVLNGQSIVFPADMAEVRTTMVHGDDAAAVIARLVCNAKALGQTVHAAAGGGGGYSQTWQEVLAAYRDVLESHGVAVKTYCPARWAPAAKRLGNYWQVQYARAVNREFSGEKLSSILGDVSFTPMRQGLQLCLAAFLEQPRFAPLSWRRQAYYDRVTHEHTPLGAFSTIKQKLAYLAGRHIPLLT